MYSFVSFQMTGIENLNSEDSPVTGSVIIYHKIHIKVEESKDFVLPTFGDAEDKPQS